MPRALSRRKPNTAPFAAEHALCISLRCGTRRAEGRANANACDAEHVSSQATQRLKKNKPASGLLKLKITAASARETRCLPRVLRKMAQRSYCAGRYGV